MRPQGFRERQIGVGGIGLIDFELVSAIVYEMPAEGADKYTSALAAHRSIGANRACDANCVSVSANVYGSISAKVLPAYDSTNACSSAMSSFRTSSEISPAAA
jgi:hypothetical protein